MQNYINSVTSTNGDAVAGATVTVLKSDGTTPTLYAANGSSPYASNVLTADSKGQYSFYAANGTYTITVSSLNFTGQTNSGVVLFDPNDNLPNSITGSFTRWQAAKARGAANPARFLMLGDSNKVGAGAGTGGATALDNAMPLSMSRRFAVLAGLRYDGLFGDQNCSGAGELYSTYDTRVALGTGWTSSTSNGTMLGGRWFSSAAANNATFDFTPNNAFDSFRIYYSVTSTGNTGARVFVDGVQVGVVNMNGAGNTFSNSSFACSRGTHKISIDANGGTGTAVVMGIQTYDSTSATPIFIHAGWWGAHASDFAQNTNAWDSVNQIQALAPDFTIFQCTINDSANLGTTAATAAQFYAYYNWLETIISTAAATSDGCLEVGYPFGGTRYGAVSGDYDTRAQMLRNLARTYGWSFIDLRDTFGYSFTAVTAKGYVYDISHPNAAGHLAAAQQEYKFLTARGF